MPFVLDASIAASWGLADEESALAEVAQARLDSDIALVPSIWWYEIRNLLLINERRQRIAPGDSAAFLALLSSYPIQMDETHMDEHIFSLARRHRLSFYDAAYLDLASRNAIPFATLDKALASAAVAAGVELLA